MPGSQSRRRAIKGFRIWPAPRWPLIHEAKRIYLSGGVEALQLWAASLSPGDRAAIADQLTDLLRAAIERVEREDKGKAEE
jgi:hypothetical protein